jgi:hypothetical protein
MLCIHSESENFLGRTCAHENIIDGAMTDVIKDNFCSWLLNINGVRYPVIRLS